MSFLKAAPPVSKKKSDATAPAIELIIEGRPRDIGGLMVARVLPSAARRMVGPFIFFDHFGPVHFAAGQALDVRPHPHINLATVSYLFEGEMVHRDSLGSHQVISPGAINWMTAGRGIVHSERTPKEQRNSASRLHGIQLWVALPKAEEEIEPDFRHHPEQVLPVVEQRGVRLRVLLGSAYGAESPVRTLSSLFYVEALLGAGAELPISRDDDERAAYIVEGTVSSGMERFTAGQMLVFTRGAPARLLADTDARVMLLGGASLDGPRHIDWNFVSSSKERIEQAKQDWKEGRFPKVPGDEEEFIPLPDDPPPAG
jgi:redox-sensitive bicupin YhaK (pirin superfamily)